MAGEQQLPYRLFTLPEQRAIVAQASIGLANLIIRGGFDNVICIDRSGRNIAIGAVTALSQEPYLSQLPTHQVEHALASGLVTVRNRPKFPGFMFINPHGLVPHGRRTVESILSEISGRYKGANRYGRTLIVDTCTHRGDTLRNVRDVLAATGFTQLETAIISETDVDWLPVGHRRSINPDHVILTQPALDTCYPFGWPEDSGRTQEGTHVSARRLRNKQALQAHTQARLEIRNIVYNALRH